MKLRWVRPQQIDSWFQKKGLRCKISRVGSFCMLWSVGTSVGTCRFVLWGIVNPSCTVGNYSKTPKRLRHQIAWKNICCFLSANPRARVFRFPIFLLQKIAFHSQAIIQRPVFPWQTNSAIAWETRKRLMHGGVVDLFADWYVHMSECSHCG